MAWLHELNKSLDYIEENLTKDIDIDRAANIACVSKYHFQRMFHICTGQTIGEYIWKRRLTLAAQELMIEHKRIIDVALKYGYSSPEAFTRAFKKLHGINPSLMHGLKEKITAYPRLSFQIQVKGAEKMEYRIEEKGAFQVLGQCRTFSTKDGENFKRIPEFWEEILQSGLCCRLAEKSGALGVMGITLDYDENSKYITYMIGIEKPDVEIEEKGLEIRNIPPCRWAIFQSEGPVQETMPQLFQRIYAEWFPSTGFAHGGGPELEVYLMKSNEVSQFQIYIPIEKQ